MVANENEKEQKLSVEFTLLRRKITKIEISFLFLVKFIYFVFIKLFSFLSCAVDSWNIHFRFCVWTGAHTESNKNQPTNELNADASIVCYLQSVHALYCGKSALEYLESHRLRPSPMRFLGVSIKWPNCGCWLNVSHLCTWQPNGYNGLAIFSFRLISVAENTMSTNDTENATTATICMLVADVVYHDKQWIRKYGTYLLCERQQLVDGRDRSDELAYRVYQRNSN